MGGVPIFCEHRIRDGAVPKYPDFHDLWQHPCSVRILLETYRTLNTKNNARGAAQNPSSKRNWRTQYFCPPPPLGLEKHTHTESQTPAKINAVKKNVKKSSQQRRPISLALTHLVADCSCTSSRHHMKLQRARRPTAIK